MLPESLRGSFFDLFDASSDVSPLFSGGADDATASPLATFTVSTEGLAMVDDSVPEEILVNHDQTVIGWRAKAIKFWSGQIVFKDEYAVEGTLDNGEGERIPVIGYRRAGEQAEQGNGAPPTYYTAVAAPAFSFAAAAADEDEDEEVELNFDDDEGDSELDEKKMESENSKKKKYKAEAKVAKTPSVETECYVTERRQLDKDGKPIGEWAMWGNIYIGNESVFGVPSTVFYVQTSVKRVDVSETTLTYKQNGKICYTRTARTEYNTDHFTFDITLEGIGSESSFSGTWTDTDDRKAEEVKYEWRGSYSMSAIIPRDPPPPPILDDAGNSLTKLLGITSKGTQFVTKKLPNSDQTITEEKIIDIAQSEGDRIYGQILLNAIPNEYRLSMYPDLPKLDGDAKSIMNANGTFFWHASTVTLLQQWAETDRVPANISSRIRKDKLKCFWDICKGVACTDKYDPVKEYGWDHKRDEQLISDLKSQFLQATASCYRLGYTRQVNAFKAYLDQATFWYPRLSTWMGKQGVREIQKEATTSITKARDKVMEYHTQLVLLRAAMGDAPLEPGISEPDKAIEGMGEVLQMKALEAIEWDDVTKQHFTEILNYLNLPEEELMKKHEGVAKAFASFKQAQLESGIVDVSHTTLKLFDKMHQMFPRLGAWELAQKASWNIRWKIIDAPKAAQEVLLEDKIFHALFDEFKLQEVGRAEKVMKWITAHIRSIMAVACAAVFIGLTTGDKFTTAEKVVLWGHATMTIGHHLAPAARWLGNWLNRQLPKGAQAYLAGIRSSEKFALWAARLGKLGKLLVGAFAFGLSLIFTVRAYQDMVDSIKHGRAIDAFLATGSFIFMAVETLVLGAALVINLGVAIGVVAAGTVGGALALCGVIGSVCILAGVVLAVVALAVWFFFPPKGPMEVFMDDFVGKKMGNLVNSS